MRIILTIMLNNTSSDVIVINLSGDVEHMNKIRASQLARDHGLDLVEVNRNNGTSVYKIMDKGKWKYDQKKKSKKSHASIQKQMKFGVRIEKHDFDTKISHIRKFISKGHDVSIIVMMRGRERAHPEIARAKMSTILSCFDELIRYKDIKSTNNAVSVLVHSLQGKNHK